MSMHLRPLVLAQALAASGFSSPVFSEPTAAECSEASAGFAEMLQGQRAGPGIGWILYPPVADFDSSAKEDQWRNVAERLSVEIRADQLEVSGDPNFSPATSRDARLADAKRYLMLDTLEACLRSEALAASPDVAGDINQFDSRFTPDIRASLQSKMRARL